MKQYCIYIVSEKLRSKPISRYKAYKIRKHFKSKLNTDIKVKRFMDVVFETVYNTEHLLELGLIG